MYKLQLGLDAAPESVKQFAEIDDFLKKIIATHSHAEVRATNTVNQNDRFARPVSGEAAINVRAETVENAPYR